MDVIIEKQNDELVRLGLGDLIECDGEFYLVIRTRDGFIAKCLDGTTGLFGSYKTLDEFNRTFNNRRIAQLRNAVAYKANEFSLKLVRKEPTHVF